MESVRGMQFFNEAEGRACVNVLIIVSRKSTTFFLSFPYSILCHFTPVLRFALGASYLHLNRTILNKPFISAFNDIVPNDTECLLAWRVRI